MNIDEALYFIHEICWKGSVPGLSRIDALLEKMGRPERKLRFVHVAGTNGKGSTCAMLASIFQAAGYTTGLYTSPYIVQFGERIQVNGEMISDEDLCELTEYVKPLAMSMEDRPTEFEVVTAIGFEYFARKKCDIVICEVGMGGEFDATNVILPPELSVICNIGLDHTEVLGDTLEKIASAKAGIIKQGSDAVVYRAAPSVEAVFEETCKRMNCRCIKADFDSIELVSHSLEGQCFNWGRFEKLQLPLLGDHQLHNAAVVLTAATALQEKGWNITDEDIRNGIANVSWPGRFEILRRKPLFIVDGGHNPQCIEALVKNIDDYLQGRELTVLTGVLADKDYNCMYENVAPYVKQFVTITPASPRAMQAADLAAYLSRFGKRADAYEDVSDGVKAAIKAAGSNGVILCYGSLYMLGDIIAAVDEALPKE